MNDFILDASVAAKWFLPEPGADRARSLLRATCRLVAPDPMPIEIASIARKEVRQGVLQADEAVAMVQALDGMPVEVVGVRQLLPRAVQVAGASGRTVEDAVYLTLAEDVGAPMITADGRLVGGLAGSPWETAVIRVQDVPLD